MEKVNFKGIWKKKVALEVKIRTIKYNLIYLFIKQDFAFVGLRAWIHKNKILTKRNLKKKKK